MKIEKMNFVRDGVSRLPPGFRFEPSEEEIIFQYLKSKSFGLPLPASIIPDFLNVCFTDPWDLPGDSEQEKYFFTKDELRHRHGAFDSRRTTNRVTRSGYWRVTGANKIIKSSSRNNLGLRGLKKTWVFHTGKPLHGSKTEWFMHEYTLQVLPNSGSSINQKGAILQKIMNSNQGLTIRNEDWKICCVFQRRKMSKNADVAKSKLFNVVNDTNNVTFSSSCSSSSSSSSITEVSSCHFHESDSEQSSC